MSQRRERISGVQEEAVSGAVADGTQLNTAGVDDAGVDSSEPESAEESVRRAMAELESQAEPDGAGDAASADIVASDEEGSPDTKAEKAQPKKRLANQLPTDPQDGENLAKTPEKQAKQEDIDPDLLDPDLQPPERFSPKAKTLFNNVPKGLKRELSKLVRDVEAGGSKVVQDARRESEEVRSIRDAVQPFAAEWAERGFTVPQGIMSLARAQQKLVDPKTRIATAADLLRDLQITPEQIAAHLSGNGQTTQNNQPNPQNDASLQETRRLRSEIEQFHLQQQAKPAVDSMNTARHEVDPASGKLRYPELHDEVYLDSLKTRVLEILGHEPGKDPGAALLQANAERKQALFGYSQQVSPQTTTRLQPAHTINRAQQAAVSVRGKISSGTGQGSGNLEPPPEALKNPAATTKWVLENMRRGSL